MAIPIIGGLELTTPVQAMVMILGFDSRPWEVTRRIGFGKNKTFGSISFLPI
jgi:hypothetical protein